MEAWCTYRIGRLRVFFLGERLASEIGDYGKDYDVRVEINVSKLCPALGSHSCGYTHESVELKSSAPLPEPW